MDDKKIDELKQLVVPKLFGHDKIKEALLLQLVSDDISIMITGDNATGKSTILRSIWIVDGGEFREFQQVINGRQILSDYIVCIDDVIIKKSLEEAILLDVLNNNRVLMAVPPNAKRYDPFEYIMAQIGLPKNIINKFDMIFIMRDIPNNLKDETVLEIIFDDNEQEIQDKSIMLREHLNRTKTINPEMSEEAKTTIKEYFNKMRQKGDETNYTPINYHIAQTITKLSKAYAKLLLKDIVTKEEAMKAIDLTHFMIMTIGIDPETGKVDIDRVYTKPV